jgi:hypothetical protein
MGMMFLENMFTPRASKTIIPMQGMSTHARTMPMISPVLLFFAGADGGGEKGGGTFTVLIVTTPARRLRIQTHTPAWPFGGR